MNVNVNKNNRLLRPICLTRQQHITQEEFDEIQEKIRQYKEEQKRQKENKLDYKPMEIVD